MLKLSQTLVTFTHHLIRGHWKNVMFFYAILFGDDISKWHVSNVDSMFSNANSFNGDISKWDVSSVVIMDSMFSNVNVFNGDIQSGMYQE